MEGSEKGKGECREFEKCLEILRLMLDNEASKEQEAYLNNHIDGCMVCFEQYQLEKQIKTLLQTKLEKKLVPADLVDSIRVKIAQSPA